MVLFNKFSDRYFAAYFLFTVEDNFFELRNLNYRLKYRICLHILTVIANGLLNLYYVL